MNHVTRTIMTPAAAAKILKTQNKHNRPLSQHHVNKIANDIDAGRWMENGDTIRFSNSGLLVDGQHRLAAIVKACKAVPVLLMTGVPDDAFMTIDTGHNRSAGDVLALAGHDCTKRSASAARVILRYFENLKAEQITNSRIVQYVTENPSIAQSSKYADVVRRFMIPSNAIALHFMFSKQDRDFANEFFSQIGSGANLAPTSPILALREAMSATVQGKSRVPLGIDPQRWRLAIAIKMWNAWCADRPVSMCRWNGAKGEPFPEIKS